MVILFSTTGGESVNCCPNLLVTEDLGIVNLNEQLMASFYHVQHPKWLSSISYLPISLSIRGFSANLNARKGGEEHISHLEKIPGYPTKSFN